MSIIKKMRKQTAVWWERDAAPDEFGKFSFAEPVEIECRWDDCLLEQQDAKGQMFVADAVVYVDRIMKPGDRLQRDVLDSDTPDDPNEATDIYEIRKFDQNPNLKNTETLLTAHMKRS